MRNKLEFWSSCIATKTRPPIIPIAAIISMPNFSLSLSSDYNFLIKSGCDYFSRRRSEFLLAGGLGWYFSTQHGQIQHLRVPLVLLLLILLSGAWLTNQGHDGSTPYFALLLCNGAIIIAPATYRWYLFALVLFSTLLCTS
ncbi:MAG: hypothetical protein ACJA2O_002879 [Candidatus Azotimanducaceae bacterium]